MLAPSPSTLAAPRGVTPDILWTLVVNTAPFITTEYSPKKPIDASEGLSPRVRDYLEHPAVQHLREWNATSATHALIGRELTHAEYFALCLSAHHATVATFVPTDVENQIRFRLWHPALESSVLTRMTELVLDSLTWDSGPVTARLVRSPDESETLSGHHGEWLSTAVPSYSVHRVRDPRLAAHIAHAVELEVTRQARVYEDLRKRRDGLNLLRAASLISHNLADLDRALDLWSLPENDLLRQAVYRLGHGQPVHGGVDAHTRALLAEAGALNRELMADENHRHFALRKPRGIRAKPEHWAPIGPFFDDWGTRLAQELGPEPVGELVEALVGGWEWFKKNKGAQTPVGYARALAGVLESFAGGLSELSPLVSPDTARALRSGELRGLITLPRERFEAQWEHHALNFIKGARGMAGTA